MSGAFSCGTVGAAWETFTGVDAYGQEVSPFSPLDSKLDQTPPCSTDELLDEEAVIAEFRAQGRRVVERLLTVEAVRTLIEYVTREPPANIPQGSRCRRPYVAAELLSSNSRFLFEVMVHPQYSDELLASFWGFMDSPAEATASPALAGYFCRTASALFAHFPAEVAAYLRRQDLSELLEHFLGSLELRCFAELLALLLSAETPAHLVFPTGQLAWRLVDCLKADAPASCSARPEHVAFLLDHLLSRACAGDLCYAGEFLHQFAAPDIVVTLVDQVLDEGLGSGPAATVLSHAVAHLHLMPCHPLLPTKSPELRTPSTPPAPGPRLASPPRPPAPLGDRDDAVEAGLDDDVGPGVPAAPSTPGREEDPNSTGSVAASAGHSLALASAALVGELCAQLPRLCHVLEAVARKRAERGEAERSEVATPCQALHEAIVLLLHANGKDGTETDVGSLSEQLRELGERSGAGEVRDTLERHGWSVNAERDVQRPIGSLHDVLGDLRKAARFRRSDALETPPTSGGMDAEVLCLLALLVKTGRTAVFEAMLAAEALPRCLEMLLASARSTVLHNAVRAVFEEVLGDREHGLQLVLGLLRIGPLMRRVVAEQRRDVEAGELVDGQRYKHSQIGYMGHLRSICADLSKLAGCTPEVAAALAEVEGWSETVLPRLEATEHLQSEPLGGQHPEAAGLALQHFDCLMAMHGAMADQSDEVDLSLEDLRDINEDLDVQHMLSRAEQHVLDRAGRRSKPAAKPSHQAQSPDAYCAED